MDAPLSPPTRPQSAPAASLSHSHHLSWDPTDAAHLGPSRITFTRLYQRAPKAPYHRIGNHFKAPFDPLPKSPGPQKKKQCLSLDAGPNPFHPTDSLSDPSDDEDPTPVSLQDLRSSSAPPEDTNPPDIVPSPRISDDTAILHAFLSRAAASKRPITASKRESIENRRDSDVVRQALASADKPGITNEVDPNMLPSDSDPQSPMIEADPEPEPEPVYPVVEPPTSTPDKPKAPRRTTRTRTPASAQTKPAKIAIRSAANHVALKRTEAQELASLTRLNTRKNKGKSVMPPVRLQALSDENIPDHVAAETPAPDQIESEKKTLRRGIQWDQTLAYIQEFESDEPDSPPNKPKARQTRVSARAMEPFVPISTDESVASVVADEPVMSEKGAIPAATATATTLNETDATEAVEGKPTQTSSTSPIERIPRPRAAPSKRKSRIATPARPSKLAPVKPERTATSTPLLPPTLPLPQVHHQSQPEANENRLGTPKKPPTSLTALKPTSLTSRLEFPPKHDSAASVPATVGLPGLASPAKKRARTTLARSAVRPAQKDSDSLPGLASPAKRKRAGIKF